MKGREDREGVKERRKVGTQGGDGYSEASRRRRRGIKKQQEAKGDTQSSRIKLKWFPKETLCGNRINPPLPQCMKISANIYIYIYN